MKTYDSTLAELLPELRFDRTSLERYYESVFDRIEALDGEIHAFVDGSVEKRRITRRRASLEESWDRRPFRPPLYGVPVGVKDVFRVDGYPTRAGSSIDPEALEGPESAVVSRLRSLGAIVVGKTVTTEFTHLPTGPTRNPNAMARTPGGSSSGSAAAVAAGMCPLSLGTETTGSVIRPAAFCGIVGFRPSRGRIPLEGTISLAPTVDSVGLFTQDLEGARRVAALLCENWTRSGRSGSPPTVGVPDGTYLDQASQAGLARFRTHVSSLEAAGFEVERIRLFEDIERVNETHEALIATEAAGVHAEWYTAFPDSYSREMVELLERGEGMSVEAVGQAKRSMERTRAGIESAFDSAGIDMLVAPPAPDVAPAGLDDDGDPVMNLPWAHAGVPAVTLPVGSTDTGLPVGIACIGRFGRDEQLLAHSRAVDEAL